MQIVEKQVKSNGRAGKNRIIKSQLENQPDQVIFFKNSAFVGKEKSPIPLGFRAFVKFCNFVSAERGGVKQISYSPLYTILSDFYKACPITTPIVDRQYFLLLKRTVLIEKQANIKINLQIQEKSSALYLLPLSNNLVRKILC